MTAPQGQITYTSQPPPQMTYEQYLAAVTAISVALAGTVIAISVPYQAAQLSRDAWLSFLAATYPYVYRARSDIADLSRTYYDAERARNIGPVVKPLFEKTILGIDGKDILGPNGRPILIEDAIGQTGLFYERLSINLAPYEPSWYEEAMDAVVDDLIKAGSTDNQVARVVSQTLKEAENGGRRTNLWAVQDDPNVIGWARVEGNEHPGSCAFCAMLISRGPVYTKSPANAGLQTHDQTRAVEIWRQAQAAGDDSKLMELMNRWHPNCDCKVVPVFDKMNWPGKDRYEEYLTLWYQTAKGGTTDERFNAFRRAIDNGAYRDLIQLPTAA